MAGYTRQSTAGIVDGGVISASDLNNEFNQVQTAMGTGGHDHSGTAGNGPKLTATGLADNAVTTAKINADAVTNAKIADDSIDSEHYVDGSIDTAHLADNAVTAAKLDETGSYTVAGLTVSSASIVLEGATADDFETTITVADPTADRTVTIQDATDTLVGRATTDTLTNKSISLTNNTVTGSLSEFNTALSGDSFVSLTGTETLTNKTLTSPTITSPTASGLSLSDSSVVFEGATANDFETTLTVTDPTADRTVTIKDASGTVALTSDITLGTLSVNATASELNIMDGDTSATSTTLADADRVVVNDNGTMKQVALTDFETYFEGALDTLSNVTTVGALDSGSITSGFGAIDNGSSNITTTGTVTYGTLNDGTTALATTVAELNTIDGNTSATSTTLADADRVVVNDDGTMKQVALTDLKTYIGTSGFASLSGATFTGDVSGTNLTLSGDLTVNGSTTTLSTTNTTVEDNLLELNSGATSNANDSGIIIERGSTGDNAVMLWDESADKFAFGTTTATADSTGNITYTTAGLTLGSVDVDNINVNGNAITSTNTDGNIAITPNGTGEVDISKVDIDSGAIDGTIVGANSAAAGTFTNLTGTVVSASTSLALASGATVTAILDEDNMSSNSATSLATQQSIKAYVDAEISSNTAASFTNAIYEQANFDFTVPAGVTECVVMLSGGGGKSQLTNTTGTDAVKGMVRITGLTPGDVYAYSHGAGNSTNTSATTSTFMGMTSNSSFTKGSNTITTTGGTSRTVTKNFIGQHTPAAGASGSTTTNTSNVTEAGPELTVGFGSLGLDAITTGLAGVTNNSGTALNIMDDFDTAFDTNGPLFRPGLSPKSAGNGTQANGQAGYCLIMY